MSSQGLHQTPGSEMVNGYADVTTSSLSDNATDMLEQIKQLLVENNNLKETMKKKNQEMKERLEELLKREKQREEQGITEPGLLEAKQRLFELSNENVLLKKEIQHLKDKDKLSTQASDSESGDENVKQLKAQLFRLQAEKADLLGIISELQVKLGSCASEDSFVEIRFAEKELVSQMTEDKAGAAATIQDIISYRTKSTDEDDRATESEEELAVSKLLHSLREETGKVEQLQRELLSANERLAKLVKKQSDFSDAETETEQAIKHNGEAERQSAERMSEEVDILKHKVEALNKELCDTNKTLNEAQQIRDKLQDRCLSLDKKLAEKQADVNERQTLLHSVQTLELQVESLKSEIRMEQSRTEDQTKLICTLQEAIAKCDYDLLRKAESEKVPKAQFCELAQKLDACEQALAKKQSEIDEMKEIVARHQEDVETMTLLRAQIDVYCSDFHAEREARENIHQEKEQLASRLAYVLQQYDNLKEQLKGGQSMEQLQRRHGPTQADGSESPYLVPRGAENMGQPSIPVYTCPKCQLTVPDIDTLQIHVMDCIT